MPVILEGADAANSTATTAQMGVDDYFYGNSAGTGDSDWIEVNLVAGQTYTFGLVGIGALSDRLADPYLFLRDGTGAFVSSDNDSGPGFNSGLTFTASTTGTYYLDVQSFGSSNGGDYGLSMVSGSRASYDVMMGAGNLIRSGASWAPTPETGASVTWSIRTSGSEPAGGTGFVAPSAAQVLAVGGVMDYIAGISGLSFTQVDDGSGTSNNATMVFGAYSANDGRGAYAFYPGSTASGSYAGDVWLNNNSVSTTSLPIGSYSNFVMLHEVGHAIGLAHPGDYNAGSGGGTITYATHAQFTEDTHQYTVMSYFDESYTTTSVGSYPDTFLLFDMLAIHQQYGANMAFHAGDTIYGFNATETGGAYDFTYNTDPLMCIWDGSGNDTIDLSGYAMGQTVNLEAGTFSSIGGYHENVSIAIGAVIENAIGGSGDDYMTGNDVGNLLEGRDGLDILSGAGGADTLYGGNGTDLLLGNQGNDRLYGDADSDSLYGQNGNDRLYGGSSDDRLEGHSGNDKLFGETGSDVIYGGTGDDRIFGGNGHDYIEGNQDVDRINGGNGNDTIDGGTGDDTIRGEVGNDTIFGGFGNDRIYGDVDNDVIFGGSDHDWIHGGSEADELHGGGGGDTVIGADGQDTIYGDSGSDWLYGGADIDVLDGGKNKDRLYGGGGDDLLNGGGQDDTLDGGNGNDILIGAGGHDTFVFGNNDGADTILGFNATDDLERIDLSDVSAITDSTDLFANHVFVSGSDIIIDDGAGTQILLVGVSLADLQTGTDFIF